MEKKRLIKRTIIGGSFGLVGLAILAGVFVGCGHRGYHSRFSGPGMDAARISGEIAKRLDLTPDQKAQLEEMVSEAKAKHEEGKDWKKSMQQDVITLVRKDRIGQADIDRLVKVHRQRMDEAVSFLSERFIRFHATLTPEQREKLVAEIENHDSHHCRFRRRW
jgi:Spy/CpxP family protein refolding chaperone